MAMDNFSASDSKAFNGARGDNALGDDAVTDDVVGGAEDAEWRDEEAVPEASDLFYLQTGLFTDVQLMANCRNWQPSSCWAHSLVLSKHSPLLRSILARHDPRYPLTVRCIRSVQCLCAVLGLIYDDDLAWVDKSHFRGFRIAIRELGLNPLLKRRVKEWRRRMCAQIVRDLVDKVVRQREESKANVEDLLNQMMDKLVLAKEEERIEAVQEDESELKMSPGEASKVVAKSIVSNVVEVVCDKAMRFKAFKDVKYDLDFKDVDMGKVFDSHCHLDVLLGNRKVTPDAIEAFLTKRCGRLGNIEGCIAVFCWIRQWPKAHELIKLKSSKKFFPIVGVHPTEARYYMEIADCIFEKILASDIIVAVGEIGLDTVKTNVSSIDKQKAVFERLVELAVKYGKPLCLHIREADELAIPILEKILPRDWLIHVHCFRGGWIECKEWLSRWPNTKFGFVAGYFDYDLVSRLSMDKILLETDAPYLSLHPSKTQGKRVQHHPGQVVHVASQIAAIKGIHANKVLDFNRQNVEKIYGV